MLTLEEINNCDFFSIKLTLKRVILILAYIIFLVFGLVLLYSVYNGKDFLSVLLFESSTFTNNTPMFLFLTYLDNRYKNYLNSDLLRRNAEDITLEEFYEVHISGSLPCVINNALQQNSTVIENKYSLKNYSDSIIDLLKWKFDGKNKHKIDTKIVVDHNDENYYLNENLERNQKYLISAEEHLLLNKNHDSNLYIKAISIKIKNMTFSTFENMTDFTSMSLEKLYAEEKFFHSIVINDFTILKKINVSNTIEDKVLKFEKENFEYYLKWLNQNLYQEVEELMEIERISIGYGKTPFSSYTFTDNYNKLICLTMGGINISMSPTLQLNSIYPYNSYNNQNYKNDLYFKYDEKDINDDDHIFKWYSPVNLIDPDTGKHKETNSLTKISVVINEGNCIFIPSFWWIQFSHDEFSKFMYVIYKFKGDKLTEELLKGVLNEEIK